VAPADHGRQAVLGLPAARRRFEIRRAEDDVIELDQVTVTIGAPAYVDGTRRTLRRGVPRCRG
jgi:hypothetical protein